ncbi:MAG: FbpB family small basic protein [Caldibacillus sp.]
MRRVRLTFEEMVERNKRELQFDEKILDRVEKRLLERQKKQEK